MGQSNERASQQGALPLLQQARGHVRVDGGLTRTMRKKKMNELFLAQVLPSIIKRQNVVLCMHGATSSTMSALSVIVLTKIIRRALLHNALHGLKVTPLHIGIGEFTIAIGTGYIRMPH